MSTYTSSLGLEQINPGDQAGLWGNTTNNNLSLIDQAVTGVTPINFNALSGQTYTLTDFDGAVDEARSAVLNITGTAAGANTIVVPNKQKTYLVRNNTGQNIVFRTATPTASFTVEAGNSILIFCDGNNNVFTGIASPSVGTLSVAAGGTGQTTFGGGGFVKSAGGTSALTAAAAVNAATEVTGVLPVSNGGTGQSSLTSGSLIRGNGAGAVAPLVGTVAGQVATWNGSEWVSQAPATTIPTGVITMWSGSIASIPGGWFLCDGTNGTPDLRNRFIVGAGSTYAVAATGGSANATLVSHSHGFSGSGSGTTSSALGTHTHTYSAGTSTAGAHVHAITDPGHTHTTPSQAGVGQGAPGPNSVQQSAGSQTTNSSATGISINSAGDHSHTFSGTTDATSLSHTHTFSLSISGSTSTEGSSATNANLPPYFALAYIMKA